MKVEWDDDKESIFQKDKKKAVNNFNRMALNPNFFLCGFSKFSQLVFNDPEVKQLRVPSF